MGEYHRIPFYREIRCTILVGEYSCEVSIGSVVSAGFLPEGYTAVINDGFDPDVGRMRISGYLVPSDSPSLAS